MDDLARRDHRHPRRAGKPLKSSDQPGKLIDWTTLHRRRVSETFAAARTPVRAAAHGLCLGLLAVGFVSPQAALAEKAAPAASGAPSISSQDGPIAPQAKGEAPGQSSGGPAFRGETASKDARDVVEWVIGSGDSRGLPFLIVDKMDAKVFLFDGRGQMRGAAPALLGLGRGDRTVPGIGQRRLATMSPAERTTPAGRFVAALGHDLEQDVLWIDYDSALSLHRVIVGNPKERRYERLASASPLDNGISYGCINVPVAFYDKVVMPAFRGTVGIVYILPETKPIREVFAISDAAAVPRKETERRPKFLEDSRRAVPR